MAYKEGTLGQRQTYSIGLKRWSNPIVSTDVVIDLLVVFMLLLYWSRLAVVSSSLSDVLSTSLSPCLSLFLILFHFIKLYMSKQERDVRRWWWSRKMIVHLLGMSLPLRSMASPFTSSYSFSRVPQWSIALSNSNVFLVSLSCEYE